MPDVSLNLGERSYVVHVANASLSNLGFRVSRRRLTGKAALITDSNVYPLYGEQVKMSLEDSGYSVSTHIMEAGEANKTLRTVEMLAEEMVRAGHDRSSFVVALGGGVVGDVAGFTAATYYRGIPFVQVPTTVMAQVDSSVGGKTGVNLPCGKNLVGSFHQPQLVLADPTTLTSLPPRVMREGMAEMVKHAALNRPAMLRALQNAADEIDLGFTLRTVEKLPELIADNVTIKAGIVEADERETSGVRAFLNLGHTLGHGIEAAVPYGSLLHGEAVSLGLRAALYLSRKLGGLSREDEREVLDTLRALELPLVLPQEVDIDRALALTTADKKFAGGRIRFVLLHRCGVPYLADNVTQQDLQDAMKELTKPC